VAGEGGLGERRGSDRIQTDIGAKPFSSSTTTTAPPVYYGGTGVRMLRELARSYLNLVKDQTRIMNRPKSDVSQLNDSLRVGTSTMPAIAPSGWERSARRAYGIGGRVQITTDGHKAYLEAVEDASGADIDYAMLRRFTALKRRMIPATLPQLASAAI